MDPGLAIVVTVLGTVVAMGLVSLLRRRRQFARARSEPVISLPIISGGRQAVAVLVPVTLYGLILVAVGVATGGAKEHALWMVCSFVVVTALSMSMLAHPWTHAGALVLDVDRAVLRLTSVGAGAPDISVALDRRFELREEVVLGFRGSPMINVAVGQDGVWLEFHYMYPVVGGVEMPERPPTGSPRGLSLGAVAQVMHERLRAACAEGELDDSPA